MRKRWRAMLSDQSGVVAAVAALGMVVFAGFAALAVDIGHLCAVEGELQRAADAGAFAGARGLWPNTLPIVGANPSPDCATAQNRAMATAANTNNKVDKAILSGGDVTVQVGSWDYGTKQFTQGCAANTNAVKVTTRKNGVPTFIARIIGVTSVDLNATAIGVMGWVGGIGKGGLPIALNKRYISPGNVVTINFTPDPLDNGGWFADPPDSASAKTFKDYVENGSCPPLRIGDIINLQNGQDTSVFHVLQDKLTEHGGAWDTFLPVVDTDRFNHMQPIVGFVSFRITSVTQNVGITGTILGLAISSGGTPGGPNLGLLAPPKRVG